MENYKKGQEDGFKTKRHVMLEREDMDFVPMKKGILTLAIGKKYNRMAKYLAYSCILNTPSLPRAIITDDCEYFNDLYDIIIHYSKNMGDPFAVKLRLNYYSPFYETLFLDADTLVYMDLQFMWDYFGNQSIVYVGSCKKEGKWYVKEIGDLLKIYDIPWIGILNSGIFLFRKDEVGINVLSYASELHENHDGVEIPFFRKKMLPDEPFLAIAFGKYNQFPVEIDKDFGRLGRSLIEAKKIKLDITKGISRYTKEDRLVFPAVVHFTGITITGHVQCYYLAEKIRLLFYYMNIPGSTIIRVFIHMVGLVFGTCMKIIKPPLKRFLRRGYRDYSR